MIESETFETVDKVTLNRDIAQRWSPENNTFLQDRKWNI